jgi:hypothetical protein
MKHRLWSIAGFAFIGTGFLILVGGIAGLWNDHPNQGREAGLELLRMAGMLMGPGAIMLAMPHWLQRAREGGRNDGTREM